VRLAGDTTPSHLLPYVNVSPNRDERVLTHLGGKDVAGRRRKMMELRLIYNQRRQRFTMPYEVSA
jgi:hypothetical protein